MRFIHGSRFSGARGFQSGSGEGINTLVIPIRLKTAQTDSKHPLCPSLFRNNRNLMSMFLEKLSQPLSQALWTANQDMAEESLEHPFVQGIGDGSLAETTFAYYVGQDGFSR